MTTFEEAMSKGEGTYIQFTPEVIERFRQEYERAVKEERETFDFEDHDISTEYAKYLIEYFDNTR